MLEIKGEKYYSTQELSEKLNLNPATVRRWIHSGKLYAVKVGKGFVISESSLKEFFDGNTDYPLLKGM